MPKKTDELKRIKEWKDKHIKAHHNLLGWQRKIEANLNKLSRSIQGVLGEVYRVEKQNIFLKQFVDNLAPIAKDTKELIEFKEKK